MENWDMIKEPFSASFYYGENNKVRGNVDVSLSRNQEILETIFVDSGDVIRQRCRIGSRSNKTHTGNETKGREVESHNHENHATRNGTNHNLQMNYNCYVIYVDGLADSQMVEDFAIRPLKEVDVVDCIASPIGNEKNAVLTKDWITSHIEYVDYTWKDTLDEAVVELLSGNTVFFFEGIDSALVLSSKRFPTRGVGEVKAEQTMRGAKDAFNENLRTNTALLRRRVRDGRMKVKQQMVGQRSHTHIAICYVDGLVREKWLEDLEDSLNRYEIDAVFDSGMLEQLIEPNWKSPFPQFQYTERPDKAASALLEGRIVLIVDNSPSVLILPATANTFFQAADDYYCRHSVANFTRILRYIAAFLAVGLPALYLSVISYHTEILPVQLILTIAEARKAVPFPAVVEVLLMELEFELLREAGVRLPGQIDNTIGVVGGLIVGQAAVEAGLVSTIVVIIVALTAISSFAIPNESFSSAFRILKFFLIGMCALWGIYGFFLGLLILFIHLSSLESFGLPYMIPAVSSSSELYNDSKDFIWKVPIFGMKKRPVFTRQDNCIRLRKRGVKK